MRCLSVISLASLLCVSINQVHADEALKDKTTQQNCAISETALQRIPNHMFDGIEFTEAQRQRMRDLTDSFRFRHSATNIRDIEQMQKLTLAPNFDAQAVRQQAEKIADHEVDLQVEMAKVRNQIYGLLTPQQKLQVQKNYEQRIDSVCNAQELP